MVHNLPYDAVWVRVKEMKGEAANGWLLLLRRERWAPRMTVLGCPVGCCPPLSCLRGSLLDTGHTLHLKANLGGERPHDVINRLLPAHLPAVCAWCTSQGRGQGRGDRTRRGGPVLAFSGTSEPPSFPPGAFFTTCIGH